jgi:hypothetical protein
MSDADKGTTEIQFGLFDLDYISKDFFVSTCEASEGFRAGEMRPNDNPDVQSFKREIQSKIYIPDTADIPKAQRAINTRLSYRQTVGQSRDKTTNSPKQLGFPNLTFSLAELSPCLDRSIVRFKNVAGAADLELPGGSGALRRAAAVAIDARNRFVGDDTANAWNRTRRMLLAETATFRCRHTHLCRGNVRRPVRSKLPR